MPVFPDRSGKMSILSGISLVIPDGSAKMQRLSVKSAVFPDGSAKMGILSVISAVFPDRGLNQRELRDALKYLRFLRECCSDCVRCCFAIPSRR